MKEKIELITKIFHGKQSKETKFMNPVVNIDATYVKKGSKRSMEVKLPAFLGNYDRPTKGNILVDNQYYMYIILIILKIV